MVRKSGDGQPARAPDACPCRLRTSLDGDSSSSIKVKVVRTVVFFLAAFAILTSACSKRLVTSGPPSVYANWKGSRFALRVAYERYTLDNGLEVILNEDHSQPIVTLLVHYDVGEKHDPPGAEGMAHLFEHLMFRRSRHLGENGFFHYLERAGATSISGTTDKEFTVYTEIVPASQLELALWLESDRMAFFIDNVSPETLDIERRIVANESREKHERPNANVGKLIWARLFPPGHPYHGHDDVPDGLARVSVADVQRFGREHYRPNNATLFVGGDIQRGTAKQQIEKYFGPIVPGAVARPPSIPDLDPIKPNARLDIEAGVELGSLVMSWLTPPFGEQGDAELDVIANMLDQRWMAPDLVYEQRVAIDVDVSQHSARLSGVFMISMSLRSGVDFEKAIEAVDESLTRFGSGWRQPSMIRSSTFPFLLSLARSEEHAASRIGKMATNTFITGDPNFIERDVARYESVTPESIMRAAQQHLALDRRLITIVRPVPGAPSGGRLARQL
jgi:zinc protease